MTLFQYLLLWCLLKAVSPISGAVARRSLNIYFGILKIESRLLKIRMEALKRSCNT